MANKGWIKLHRQMLDWEWADDALTFSLFVHLLLMANSDEGWRWKGMVFKAGQLVTSVSQLAECTGLTPKQVRYRLELLSKSGEIEVEGRAKYSIITISNYNEYQFENEELANKWQTKEADIEADAEPNATLFGKQMANKGQSDWQGEGADFGKQMANSISLKSEQLAQLLQIVWQTNGKQSGKQIGNIQEYIYSLLSIEKEEDKIILDNIINTLSQNSQNAKSAQAETKEKPAPKTSEPSSELEQQFEDFRKAYQGRKRGHKEEFENFKKKNPDWREVVPLLMPALQRLEEYIATAKAAGEWVPQWANLQTWINQRRWTEELPTVVAPASEQPKAATPPTAADYAWEDFGSIDK
nr:MAG TPA: replisome organizer [Caudoviricetes sp.]